MIKHKKETLLSLNKIINSLNKQVLKPNNQSHKLSPKINLMILKLIIRWNRKDEQNKIYQIYRKKGKRTINYINNKRPVYKKTNKLM